MDEKWLSQQKLNVRHSRYVQVLHCAYCLPLLDAHLQLQYFSSNGESMLWPLLACLDSPGAFHGLVLSRPSLLQQIKLSR